MAQVVAIAIDDRKAEIFCGKLASEDARDIPARGEHKLALRFVGFAAAEGQVVVSRKLAICMLERAFGRLGVVDKLEISVIGEDVRRQAFPGDIGCAIETHAKLELLMLCRGASSANARGHFLEESLAIAHE